MAGLVRLEIHGRDKIRGHCTEKQREDVGLEKGETLCGVSGQKGIVKQRKRLPRSGQLQKKGQEVDGEKGRMDRDFIHSLSGFTYDFAEMTNTRPRSIPTFMPTALLNKHDIVCLFIMSPVCFLCKFIPSKILIKIRICRQRTFFGLSGRTRSRPVLVGIDCDHTNSIQFLSKFCQT